MKIKTMAQIGLMTALLCVISPFSIPLSLVPISLGTFGIYLTALVLGWKKSAVSVLLYILLGGVGLPVFAGGAAGFQVLAGPTGGYLVGFVLLAVVNGWFADRFDGKVLPGILGMAAGTAVCYLFGTLWLAYMNSLSFGAALAAGVLPFLIGDGVKIAAAAAIGCPLRKRLRKSGVL